MELEQRVHALEQEVHLLKNQIQALLLDIQEQLLTNTYPTLMADTPSPTKNDAPADPPAPARSNPVKVFTPEASTADDDTVSASSVNVRQVSLDDLQGGRASGSVRRPSPPPPQSAVQARQVAPAQPMRAGVQVMSPQSAETTDWSTMAELEDWACKKVERLGAERTRQLILMYGEKGRIAPDATEALLEIVEMYGYQNNVQNSAQNGRRSANTRQPQQPSRSQRAARSERPARPTRPQRTPQAAPVNQPNWSPPIEQPQYSRSAPQRPNNPSQASRAPEPVPEEDPNSQNVILRLIAGVQNAGAGVKWSKRHG